MTLCGTQSPLSNRVPFFEYSQLEINTVLNTGVVDFLNRLKVAYPGPEQKKRFEIDWRTCHSQSGDSQNCGSLVRI